MASPYAFVSLLTSDSYLPGALTLVAALRDVHSSPPAPPEVDFQTICLVTPETVDIASIKLLRKAFNVVIGVEIIEEDNAHGLKLLGRPDLTTVLTKLHAFRLTQYSKIIFLDADILPTRPLSHLFTLPHDFSAVPDVGWPDIFNSGLMVFTPGEDKFNELMTLSEIKGSWDGGDQGLLNEWRGTNWNRLSFTYNTTPTAIYTYAPAYERFGSQISAIHFIGPNKPWSDIPWRAPGSKSAQDAASDPLQVYDYSALVDRWFAIYDKHYRSAPALLPTEYASRRYEAAWDQESSSIGAELAPPLVTSEKAPLAPLGLEELRRIAIEGFPGLGGSSMAALGEGEYVRLPLQGRLDLMRPKPEPAPDVLSASGTRGASTDDGGRGMSQGHFPQQGQYTDGYFPYPTSGPSTPRGHAQHLYGGEGSPPRMTTLPTPGPDELPPAPYSGPLSLPPTPTPSHMYYLGGGGSAPSQGQPLIHWQGQSQLQPHGGPGHADPQGQPHPASQQGGTEFYPPPRSSLTQDYYNSDQGSPSPGTPQLGSSYRPSYHGTSQQAPPFLGHPQQAPAYQGQSQQGMAHQGPAYHGQGVHLERQAHGSPTSQDTTPVPEYPHGGQRARQHGAQGQYQGHDDTQDQHLGHFPGHPRTHRQQQQPEQQYDHHPTTEPPPPPPQQPPRPVSPPMVSWNPAVEPPPNTAPLSNFPTSTYYPNVWDEAGDQTTGSDHSPVRDAGPFFPVPPLSKIPERLLQERHYANVLGDTQNVAPSPDRTKVKPVFPWEDSPRHAPGRVFPSTDSPPPGLFLKPIPEVMSSSPSPPARVSPQSYSPRSPGGLPPSFGYTNAWDTIPSIQNYASRLVRSPQSAPPLAPAFDIAESRRRESKLFKSWQEESGESSVDGDDEDTEPEQDDATAKRRSRSGSSSATAPFHSGKGKSKREYRSQGVQTIPKETRQQGVQTSLPAVPDTDRDHAGKDRDTKPAGLRSRHGSYSGTPMRRDGGTGGESTSTVGDSYMNAARLSPLGSPTGLRSPRAFVSPRGSLTNLVGQVPALSKPVPPKQASTPLRMSTQRGPPSPMARTISSSDAASSPSSAGPPVSPSDVPEVHTPPTRKVAGRVWDPARGVDIFKKGSEEVLARFLRMGSWEEEERERQSQSGSPVRTQAQFPA